VSPSAVRARRRLVVALSAIWIMAPLLLMAARWPSWWSWIAPEQTPMTWLQSVVLVVAAAASLLVAYVLQLAGERKVTAWWVLAAGFGVLAFDERFAVHERVRDGVLAPRGVAVPFLPWVAAGDFLLLVAGLVGLALLPMVWRALRADRGALIALVVGVGLAVVAVGMDSIDPSTWTTQAERAEQTAEEVVELASGLALLAAVALRLLGLLDAATGPPAQPAAADETTVPVDDEVREARGHLLLRRVNARAVAV
jgi:hypothetical protein